MPSRAVEIWKGLPSCGGTRVEQSLSTVEEQSSEKTTHSGGQIPAGFELLQHGHNFSAETSLTLIQIRIKNQF